MSYLSINRRSLWIGLTSLLSLCMPAFAESGRQEDPVLLYREAGADTTQEGEIRQMARDFEKLAKVRLEKIRNLSKQMRELSYEAEPDESKILSAQEEMNQVQSNLNLERVKLMFAIRKVLSPEQRQKLVQLMRERQNAHASKSQ